MTFPCLVPRMPSWAQQCRRALYPKDKVMTTPSFQGKWGCGKQLGFSGTFTEDPAAREPLPDRSLVRSSAAAPAVPTQGKTCGEVIGSHRLSGRGG